MTIGIGRRPPAARRRRQLRLRVPLLCLLSLAPAAPLAASPPADATLRAAWGRFVVRYETERDRLLAGELCADSWDPLAAEIDAFASRLGRRHGRRRAAEAERDLAALGRRLEDAAASCGERLLERYRTALQGHRKLEVTIAELLAEDRVPDRLRDRLELLRAAAATAIAAADARHAAAGGSVLALEASERRLAAALVATDPCGERLASLAGDPTAQGDAELAATADELCRIAESACLWPPHRERARELLATVLRLRPAVAPPRDRLERCTSPASPVGGERR